MAFNKAPTQSTYQTKDVKLIQTLDNRNAAGAKDIISLNGFYDIIENKNTGDKDYNFVKRDGTVEYPFVPTGSEIRGMHYWKDENKLFIAYDDDIAIVTASTGVLITTVTPWTTSTGDVSFVEFQYANGDVKVVACDGVRLITIDSSNVVVTGADADMPTPMKPYLVYLDGYIFLIKAGTSDIYNSNLDSPLVFTSGDFITAEMAPDELVRIDRTRNYLVAFGTQSIEYFYDAANASGSPLSRNDTPFKQVGYLGGLARYESQLYFVGQSDGAASNPEVYMLEDFKMEETSVPPLRRFMQPTSTFKGAIVSQGGRDFYVVNSSDITYVMDLQTGIWTRWAFKNTTTFPIKYSAPLIRTGIGNTTIMAFDGDMATYLFDPDLYQDDGVNFTTRVQTERLMFETMHNKFMSRLLVVSDRTTIPALLEVRYTDDDYQTYSAVRTIDLSLDAPVLHRLGKFRRRAFDLQLTANVPQRMRHLEVDFNIGAK